MKFAHIDYYDAVVDDVKAVTHEIKDWWWQGDLLCLETKEGNRQFYHKDIIKKLNVPSKNMEKDQ